MELLKIPAELSKYQGLAQRAIRLQFDSQQNQSDEVLGKVAQWHEKTGWLLFLPEKPIEGDLTALVKDLPPLKLDDDKKSPSQEVRDALFVAWTQKNTGGDFNEFYIQYMKKLKNKILEGVL